MQEIRNALVVAVIAFLMPLVIAPFARLVFSALDCIRASEPVSCPAMFVADFANLQWMPVFQLAIVGAVVVGVVSLVANLVLGMER